MLTILASKDSIQLTTSSKTKVSIILSNTANISLDPVNINLLSKRSFNKVWSGKAETICLPGQYGRSDLEISCHEDSSNHLFYNINVDNLKLGIVPKLDSDEELSLESSADLVVINCGEAKTDKIISFLNNLTAKNALVIGSDSTIVDLVEKSKLSFQDVEKEYRHKNNGSEALQLFKYVV